MKNFARPIKPRTLPNVFNKKQLLALFECMEDNTVFIGSLIALFCGLRISEVCTLKKQDIDLESEKVFIRQSKGDKDRIVMLPTCIKPILEKWFRMTKDTDQFIGGMFKERMREELLSKKFRACLDKAKLKIETFKSTTGQQRYAYSFHTLRHTYATYLLEQGVDLYYVQRSLGHVDIHTTQIYAYISNKDLQNKINKAFGKQPAQEKNYGTILDPMQVLKLKFAHGEINIEELHEKISVIQSIEKQESLF